MFIKSAAFLTLATSLLAPVAFADPVNLVVNGDFSSSSYTSNSQFGTGYGGQGVTGWSGNSGYNLYFTSPDAATTVSANSQYAGGREMLWSDTASPTGGAFVGLDGEQNGVDGAISQTVGGLNVGSNYLLSFSWAAAQVQSRTGPTTEQIQASLGSQSFLTNVVSNPSQGFTGWFTTSFVFKATSISEVLNFMSLGTPVGLPPMATLDGVSLTAVPEPMSVALFGVGLAGLLVMRRRITS